MKGRICICFALLLAVGLFLPPRGVQSAFAAGGQETLVIDAGHGGFDGGAVAADGTSEQRINLRIAQSTEALAGFFGIPVVMTRTDEGALGYVEGRPIRENKAADLRERLQIAEKTPIPVFVSIHLNKFEQTQYHGAQVFYSPNDPRSKPLAEALQTALVTGTDPANHRQAKPAADSIYLMKKLQCPAVVVECGFLSNPDEAALLRQESYQKRLAVCIISGYMRSRREGMT